MDEERSLAEFLGYVSEADGVGDFGGGYVYRETTAEVLAAGLRLVTYRNALNGEEAAKALAILKSHDWRTDVLPFGFTRRVLPWGALEGVRFELPEKPDGYGRLRFTYPQHNMLDRIVHAPVDLYFAMEDQAAFGRLFEMARERIAAHRGEHPAEAAPPRVGGLRLGLRRESNGPTAADLEALEKLAALHEKGVLNDAEFAAAKARLLD
jgi:hypothetical protein